MTDGPRVAVIGLDCATPKLLFEDLADEVPNIRGLLGGALHGDLQASPRPSPSLLGPAP